MIHPIDCLRFLGQVGSQPCGLMELPGSVFTLRKKKMHQTCKCKYSLPCALKHGHLKHFKLKAESGANRVKSTWVSNLGFVLFCFFSFTESKLVLTLENCP